MEYLPAFLESLKWTTTFDTVIYLYDDMWLRLSIHIAASEILYENGKERIVPFIGNYRCRVLNGSEV